MTGLTPGTRVIRTLHGRDWPGTVRGIPYPAADGERVRVDFDARTSADVLTTDLRPEGNSQ